MIRDLFHPTSQAELRAGIYDLLDSDDIPLALQQTEVALRIPEAGNPRLQWEAILMVLRLNPWYSDPEEHIGEVASRRLVYRYFNGLSEEVLCELLSVVDNGSQWEDVLSVAAIYINHNNLQGKGSEHA